MSEDIRFFAAGRSKNTQIQKWENIDMRVGMGYDVHKLVEGRDLILGGVRIEHDKGLLGHSDADVVVHAIMDALLGAAALRISDAIFRTRIRSIRGYPALRF